MATKKLQLEEMIGPAVEAQGYELLGIEMASLPHSVLIRVYIDSPAGITVDDCGKASQQISHVLEVEEPINGDYTLEVSSPGLNRPLFTLEQCLRFVGQKVRVRLRTTINGQRKFTGVLTEVTGTHIRLTVEDAKVIDIDFADVDKANIVYEFA